MKLKIASWNIGGGIKYKEKKEDHQYLLKEVRKLDPDIVCFQESHINEEKSLIKSTFSSDYKYISEFPVSESHNDSNYRLSLSIISKYKIETEDLHTFPNPKLSKRLRSGIEIHSHDKAVQLVEIEEVFIANTQFLPLHVFNTDYANESELSRSIDKLLLEVLEKPLLFCGDFNNPKAEVIIPQTFSKLSLSDTLPGVPTYVYHKRNPDHIYLSNEFKVEHSGVIKGDMDHYLCWCEVKI